LAYIEMFGIDRYNAKQLESVKEVLSLEHCVHLNLVTSLHEYDTK